ncbi:MAG: diguanylate cyclase [Candidatus Obscuribacterales bacterium]|nr:diguanylate cyclase [Candidatus Obscuribacterales bacterium]
MPPETWDKTFQELKSQYLTRSSERLDQIGDLLTNMAKSPGDVNLLRDLQRQFHWLAGSGSIYGFPQITKLGTHGEEFCDKLLRNGRGLTRSDWDKCKALLDALRVTFSGDDDPQKQTIEKPLPKSEHDGIEVMFVDPEQNHFLFLAKLLEEQGMVIRHLKTAVSALESCSQKMPRACLISLPLSDASGYELVERIRILPGGQETVIFFVGAKSGFLDKVQAIHCGADGFFQMPVDWESVEKRLKYLLDRGKAQNFRVLSVEDDPDQAYFIRAVLESAGYQVHHIPDPMQFEEALLSFNPDLVLLDILLPGMTGYELARYLRQDERWATMPILFLTTQNQLEAHIESARAGADDHLVKPIAPALLLSAVASRLERARFLKNLLHRDGLTRLLTHTAFMEQAQAVVAQCKRNQNRLASLMLIDLDKFKQVNERFGYAAGDKVLISLSAVLRQRLRSSDVLGRFGGEEVAIIVEDLEEYDAVNLAQRLLHDFANVEHRAPDGTVFHMTFSAGVAMLDPKVMDVERWRKHAEQALKAAKNNGRNCVMKILGGKR